MKSLILGLVFFLSACSTVVPVKQKFPEAPEALKEKCPDLQMAEGNITAISDLLKVVVKNYTLYYECSTKTEGWIDWYSKQKEIYKDISK